MKSDLSMKGAKLKHFRDNSLSSLLSNWARRYIAVTPIIMALTLGLSLWLDAPEPVVYAQVQGGPTEDNFSGRLQVLEELEGETLPVAWYQVVVETPTGKELYRTDEQGWINLPPLITEGGQLSMSVWGFAKGAGVAQIQTWQEADLKQSLLPMRRLLEGNFRLPQDTWQRLARTPQRSYLLEQDKTCAGRTVRLTLPAPLAVPFPQRVKLELLGLPPDTQAPAFSAHGQGVLLKQKSSEVGVFHLSKLQFKETELVLEPTHHQGELVLVPQEESDALTHEILIKDKDKLAPTCQYFWNLPILPGAPHIDVIKGAEPGYTVTTPLKADEIFFSLVSEENRLGGGRLLLRPSKFGQAQGFLAQALLTRMSSSSSLENLTLMTSTDSRSRAVGSLPYPLTIRKNVNAYQEVLLLSGRKRALKEARSLLRKRRLLLGMYFSLAVVLFLYLYYQQISAAERQLKEAFEEVGIDSKAAEARSWSLIVILLALFFAFSLAVVWIIR